MRTYVMEDRNGLPLYEHLYRCIRRDILDGTLAAGERLPSKRALAEHLHISVMTVEAAYRQLEAEGYLTVPPPAGLFRRPGGAAGSLRRLRPGPAGAAGEPCLAAGSAEPTG